MKYVGVSSRCAIYAETDDYSGEALTNPTIADKYRRVSGGKVASGGINQMTSMA